MGCYNYSNGLFEIQVKLLKNWVPITHLFFQCTNPFTQGCNSKWSSWSGFGRTIISQGKNKILFYKN